MRFGGLGVPELLLILAIVILLFGVGRISKVMGELGKGLRAFREGLQGEETTSPEADQAPTEGPTDPNA